ncbi:MAG: hypothetical protein IH840_10365 [Candidatus Heimdallarchaeota archaeon]|nr:hypothetical protein [Candidatus Heimdallarchaeota archaeon]
MTEISLTDEFTQLLDLLTTLRNVILKKPTGRKITSHSTDRSLDNQDIMRLINRCIEPSCFSYLTDIGMILLNEIGLSPKFCYILINRLIGLYGNNDEIMQLACQRIEELVALLETQQIPVAKARVTETIFLNLLVYFARLEFATDMPVGMVIYNKYAVRVNPDEPESGK